MIWASLASFFLFSGFAQAQSKNFKQKQAPPAIEEKYAIENADSTGQLSKYFRENNCTEILKYFKDKDLLKLSPIELSIDAYCEPPGKDPDKMFKYAEEKSPDDDTILLLHGRYRWKKYMLSADEIWGKLAARTHDEKMKEMAQQYLDGAGNEAEAGMGLADGRYGAFQIGYAQESNPEGLPISDSTLSKNYSDSTLWGFSSALRSEYEFGFIDWNGSLTGTQYNTASDANQTYLEFGPLFGMQGSQEQFFLFKPNASGLTIDGRLFYASGGISLGELWQFKNSEYKILFTTYADRYYPPELQAQQGVHYRIEQKSDFRLGASTLSSDFYWEKSNATQDITPTSMIPYTNNTGTGALSYQWAGKQLILGANVSFSVRQDESESQYFDSGGIFRIKKRRDLIYGMEPWLSWRISNEATAVLFYTNTRTTSNMGRTDIIDRNVNNSLIGSLLKLNF